MNENFYELAAQIEAWHETTFPDATEESQVMKLSEEFAEYADGEYIEELADCFIVAASLSYRFGNALGTFAMKAVVKHCCGEEDRLYSATISKMEINRRRKWIKLPDGIYKHVEGKKKMSKETVTLENQVHDAIRQKEETFTEDFNATISGILETERKRLIEALELIKRTGKEKPFDGNACAYIAELALSGRRPADEWEKIEKEIDEKEAEMNVKGIKQ